MVVFLPRAKSSKSRGKEEVEPSTTWTPLRQEKSAVLPQAKSPKSRGNAFVEPSTTKTPLRQ